MQNLIENDKEYEIGLLKEDNSINEIIEEPPQIYNPAIFDSKKIINYFQKVNVIQNRIICPNCGSEMKLVNHLPSADNIIWRCHKRNPPHDIKINIRQNSIFEGLYIKLPILYFLLFFCFCENLNITNSYKKCMEYCNQMGEPVVT